MSKLTIKPNVIVDADALITNYRELVAQRYTPSSLADLDRMLPAPPYFASKKIDGELWFLSVEANGVKLVAANRRLADGESEIHTAAKSLPVGTVLAGELYAPNPKGRERVGDVAAKLAKGGEGLAFAAFDLVSHPEFTWQQAPFAKRLAALRELIPALDGALSSVEVSELQSGAEIGQAYKKIVEDSSSEGLIVRCPDGRILKIKPSFNLDLAIIGYTTQEGASGPEVRSLLLALSDGDVFVPVGTSGNAVEGFDRALLLKRLASLEVESQYRQAASTGQLYKAVKPEVIVECRMLDLQATDSQGKVIRKPELSFTESGWSIGKQRPAISLINAVLVRLRDDKPDVISGSRWSQLPEGLVALDAQHGEVIASEVIRRQVWTKDGKDKVDVRKLLVWKTNKETDPRFPAFVVHWTDFSSGRKAPLAREVKLATSKEEAESIANQMIEENIKKGWVEKVS